jgi:hypothetical protein
MGEVRVERAETVSREGILEDRLPPPQMALRMRCRVLSILR